MDRRTAIGMLGTSVLLLPGAFRPGARLEASQADPLLSKSWDEIAKEARGQTIRWWMWAGDEGINRYVDQWVAPRVKELYGVTLQRVPIKDTVEGVQKVVGEVQAGKRTGGSVDLNWISSENFLTMKQAGLLFTGYWDKFPSSKYMDWDSPLAGYSAGVPVEKMAVPWSHNQTGFAYDSAKVKEPPKTMAAFAEWVKANPGKFTYPAPPDFTGRAFVVHVLYELSGGAQQWITYDEGLYRKHIPAVWKYLNEIKPSLWRRGETHPETVAAQDQLFATGEIWITISPYVTVPARNVLKGTWAKTTRTFVVEPGTYAFMGFVGIPFNSPHKAGALCAIDVLSSPEAQYQKALPDVWGDLPILDFKRLPKESQEKFRNIPTPEAGLSPVFLATRKVPVLHAKYFTILEKEWREQVLRKR